VSRARRPAGGGAPAPDRPVVRFDAVERVVHWVTGTLVLTLVVTGAALYLPALATALGSRTVVRQVHVVAGLTVPVPLLVGALGRWGRRLRADLVDLGRWDRLDGTWLRTLGRDPAARPAKFNGGQKANAVAVGSLLVVMLLTGLVLRWYEPFPDDWRTGATFVHDIGFLALSALVVGHIGRALADPVALRAMVTGRVPGWWVRAVHPRWAVDLEVSGAQQDADPAGGHRQAGQAQGGQVDHGHDEAGPDIAEREPPHERHPLIER
jgi:formate dehydrogenase subunit gamma